MVRSGRMQPPGSYREAERLVRFRIAALRLLRLLGVCPEEIFHLFSNLSVSGLRDRAAAALSGAPPVPGAFSESSSFGPSVSGSRCPPVFPGFGGFPGFSVFFRPSPAPDFIGFPDIADPACGSFCAEVRWRFSAGCVRHLASRKMLPPVFAWAASASGAGKSRSVYGRGLRASVLGCSGPHGSKCSGSGPRIS